MNKNYWLQKTEKEKHEQNLQNLTKEIEKVSEELKSMGIEEQDTLESLCKRIIYLLCFSLFLPICFLLLVFFTSLNMARQSSRNYY